MAIPAVMITRQADLTIQTPMKLEGYAVVFDSPAQIGNYEEKILSSALKNCDMSDCCLIYNHDLNKIPLARVPNTLTLQTDQRGLKFSAVLPNTEEGRAIYESVKRGDLRGCSFAFTVEEDFIDNGRREIRKIGKIVELSLCPFPAYSDTTVEARKKGSFKMKFENVSESFNYYNEKSLADIEKRAAEIGEELKGDTADLKSLNIELEGLKQAKENIEESLGLMNNAKSILQNIIASADADEGVASVKNEEEITATADYRSAFYKTLQGKTLTNIERRAMQIAKAQLEKRANEFSTSTDSAAVIPTSTLDEIISKARKQGGLLSECRAFSVPSKIAIPVATPSDKAAWHIEGAAIDSEKVTPTTVTFDGNEIMKVFSLSTKVQTMAISAFESYLTTELENCVMDTLEDCLINGTGNGQGTGILSIFDSDNTITSSAGVGDYDVIIAGVGMLKRGYANGAKFAMNNHTLWSHIYKMCDATTRPLFIQDLQNEKIGKLLGFEVVIDDNLPNSVLIFGNFNYMAYNLPSGIVIESSRESSFKSALIDYRALAVADCKPIISEAFVKIELA